MPRPRIVRYPTWRGVLELQRLVSRCAVLDLAVVVRNEPRAGSPAWRYATAAGRHVGVARVQQASAPRSRQQRPASHAVGDLLLEPNAQRLCVVGVHPMHQSTEQQMLVDVVVVDVVDGSVEAVRHHDQLAALVQQTVLIDRVA